MPKKAMFGKPGSVLADCLKNMCNYERLNSETGPMKPILDIRESSPACVPLSEPVRPTAWHIIFVMHPKPRSPVSSIGPITLLCHSGHVSLSVCSFGRLEKKATCKKAQNLSVCYGPFWAEGNCHFFILFIYLLCSTVFIPWNKLVQQV